MLTLLLQALRQPYGPLVPWAGVVFFLLLVLWGLNAIGYEEAERTRSQLETQWQDARKAHQRHHAARQAKKYFAQI